MVDSCVLLSLLVAVIIICTCRPPQAAELAVTTAAAVPTTNDEDCPSTCPPHGVPSRCIGQAMRHISEDPMNGAWRFCGVVEIIPKGKYLAGVLPNKTLDVRSCPSGSHQTADTISLEYPTCRNNWECIKPALKTIVDGTAETDNICACNSEAGYVPVNQMNRKGQLKASDCLELTSSTEWHIRPQCAHCDSSVANLNENRSNLQAIIAGVFCIALFLVVVITASVLTLRFRTANSEIFTDPVERFRSLGSAME